MNRKVGKVLLFAAQIVFILMAFILLEWVQGNFGADGSVKFNFDALSQLWWWVVVTAQAGLAVFIVNLLITSIYDEEKRRVSSRLCKILKTNELRIDKIYSDKMFDELELAVIRVNEKAKQDCYLRHLRKHNARITSESLQALLSEDKDAVANFKKIYFVLGMNERKLDSAISKLIAGGYRDYETLKASELLSKGIAENDNKRESNKDGRAGYKRVLLGKKAIGFIGFAMAAGIIITDLIMNLSIVNVFVDSIYIFAAIFSGVFSGTRYRNYVETLFENRNNLFEMELGIADTWFPPVEVADEKTIDEDSDED